MTKSFPSTSSPGRMPIPIWRVTFLRRSYGGKRVEDYRDYDDEGHMQRALSRFKGYHGMDCIVRIDLIAAAPIDVTEAYTK
ncbi:hypothetical protein [Actinoplanes sp. NPDC026670]|uniref:hypothetical protein n=1 Tax=Actinoplanes sp. NPDC026670 TaxID=3154700 RepID=UPI0033D24A1C